MEEVGSRKKKRRKQDGKIRVGSERVTELEKRESDTSVDGGKGNEEKKRLSR